MIARGTFLWLLIKVVSVLRSSMESFAAEVVSAGDGRGGRVPKSVGFGLDASAEANGKVLKSVGCELDASAEANGKMFGRLDAPYEADGDSDGDDFHSAGPTGECLLVLPDGGGCSESLAESRNGMQGC